MYEVDFREALDGTRAGDQVNDVVGSLKSYRAKQDELDRVQAEVDRVGQEHESAKADCIAAANQASAKGKIAIDVLLARGDLDHDRAALFIMGLNRSFTTGHDPYEEAQGIARSVDAFNERAQEGDSVLLFTGGAPQGGLVAGTLSTPEPVEPLLTSQSNASLMIGIDGYVMPNLGIYGSLIKPDDSVGLVGEGPERTDTPRGESYRHVSTLALDQAHDDDGSFAAQVDEKGLNAAIRHRTAHDPHLILGDNVVEMLTRDFASDTTAYIDWQIAYYLATQVSSANAEGLPADVKDIIACKLSDLETVSRATSLTEGSRRHSNEARLKMAAIVSQVLDLAS